MAKRPPPIRHIPPGSPGIVPIDAGGVVPRRASRIIVEDGFVKELNGRIARDEHGRDCCCGGTIGCRGCCKYNYQRSGGRCCYGTDFVDPEGSVPKLIGFHQFWRSRVLDRDTGFEEIEQVVIDQDGDSIIFNDDVTRLYCTFQFPYIYQASRFRTGEGLTQEECSVDYFQLPRLHLGPEPSARGRYYWAPVGGTLAPNRCIDVAHLNFGDVADIWTFRDELDVPEHECFTVTESWTHVRLDQLTNTLYETKFELSLALTDVLECDDGCNQCA